MCNNKSVYKMSTATLKEMDNKWVPIDSYM